MASYKDQYWDSDEEEEEAASSSSGSGDGESDSSWSGESEEEESSSSSGSDVDDDSDEGGEEAGATRAHKRQPALPNPGGRPSTYRGVCFDNGRWLAKIHANGKSEHLGRFTSKTSAARAYDARAKELHKSPVLNFLPDGSLNPERKRRRGLPDPGRLSIYRGVQFNGGVWCARIGVNKQYEILGRFTSEAAAARAYDARAKEVFESPVLNFLPDGSVNPRSRNGSLELTDPDRPSIYRGVRFNGGRWMACVWVDGENQSIGRFDSEADAARAYDARAKELFDLPILNFLPDGSLNPDRKGQPSLTNPGRPSTYRGVVFHSGRWVAQIGIDGQQVKLGRFTSEEEAARTYDERAKKLHESFIPNFLPDGSLNPNRKFRRGHPTLPHPDQPSNYRGIRFNHGRWEAVIVLKGKYENLGHFMSDEAAARAYDARAKELLESPVLNFLPDGTLNPNRKLRSGNPTLPDPGRPSIYKGVNFHQGRWVARINVNGRREFVGCFTTEAAAARAFDARAKEVLKSPILNFLPDGSLNPNLNKRQPSVPDPGRPSIYRGVKYQDGRWRANIYVNGKQEYLGRFDDEADAARAYDARAKELHKSPVLNFLPDGSPNPKNGKRIRRSTRKPYNPPSTATASATRQQLQQQQQREQMLLKTEPLFSSSSSSEDESESESGSGARRVAALLPPRPKRAPRPGGVRKSKRRIVVKEEEPLPLGGAGGGEGEEETVAVSVAEGGGLERGKRRRVKVEEGDAGPGAVKEEEGDATTLGDLLSVF